MKEEVNGIWKNDSNKVILSSERLQFEIDKNKLLAFEDSTFMLIVKKNNQDNVSTIFKCPSLDIVSFIKQDDVWKIRYSFSGKERVDKIDAFGTFVQAQIRATSQAMSKWMQFIWGVKEQCESTNRYEIWHESISVVNGNIMVENTTDQPIPEILQLLAKLSGSVTNNKAFLTSLYYFILAPFSFEIRAKGQKFPYRISCGRTHGGKTAIDSFFVLRGFNQDIYERKETQNTIKTIFTLGLKVEESRLPFMVDDIKNEWLLTHAEALKGATDGIKFMVRGTKSQDRNVYRMLGMPAFTMNAEPDIPLALSDRVILSHYTEEHERNQDKSNFEQLVNSLKPGFLLNIEKEILGGKSPEEILKNVHYSARRDTEINEKLIRYGEKLISDLFLKYGLNPLSSGIEMESSEESMLEKFYTFVFTRLRSAYAGVDLKFCVNDKGKGDKEIYISSEGFNEFNKAFGYHMTMTDFINELNHPDVKVKTVHNKCLGKKARCIVMPYSLGDPQYTADSPKSGKDGGEQPILNQEKATHNEKGELRKNPLDSIWMGY